MGEQDLSNAERLGAFVNCYESDTAIIGSILKVKEVHDHDPTPEEFSQLLVVAILLRKYFMKGETVKLFSVINALVKESGQWPLSEKELVSDLRRWENDANEQHVQELCYGQGKCLTAEDITGMVIYGGPLHGDVEKIKLVADIPRGQLASMMNGSNEKHCYMVSQCYRVIKKLSDKGTLKLA